MALLVLAGWFAQSLANVARVDLGFRAESLDGVLDRAGPQRLYARAHRTALFARLEEELAQIPGVTAAAAAAVALLDNSNWNSNVSVEGYRGDPGETDTNVSMNFVSPDFFGTRRDAADSRRGIRARRRRDGPQRRRRQRAVRREDSGSATTRVGKRMAFGDGRNRSTSRSSASCATRSTARSRRMRRRRSSCRASRRPFLGETSFYLRSDLARPSCARPSQQSLARHDANLPLMDFRTVAEQARENVFLDRFMSTLAAALAVMAAVLAGIGIYGVLSYGVVQRLREIGLRIALGAAPQNVRAHGAEAGRLDGGDRRRRSA